MTGRNRRPLFKTTQTKIMADNSSSGGVGFGGLLAVVFITLKLTHYIDWSWWWVLSPFWIPLAIVLVMLLISAIVKTFL